MPVSLDVSTQYRNVTGTFVLFCLPPFISATIASNDFNYGRPLHNLGFDIAENNFYDQNCRGLLPQKIGCLFSQPLKLATANFQLEHYRPTSRSAATPLPRPHPQWGEGHPLSTPHTLSEGVALSAFGAAILAPSQFSAPRSSRLCSDKY